jgi:cytochrome P450
MNDLEPAVESGAVVSPPEPFNPFQAAFYADPYPFYRAYRERDPVHRSHPGVWWLFRHADCIAMLRDHQRFANDPRRGKQPGQARKTPPEAEPLFRFFFNGVLFVDPPMHTRLKALIKQAFTARAVEQLQPALERLAGNLLDRLAGAGRMDLMADYSLPLSVGVIAELLGAPASDRQLFSRWAAALIAAVDVRGGEDQARLSLAGAEAAQELSAYAKEMAEERRRRPRADLMTALVQARQDGDRLSEDELASMFGQLLIAGFETTASFVGNAVIALFRAPDQLELLRRCPELFASAAEELFRYDSSFQLVSRTACEDVELGGRLIPFGSLVHAVLGSTNRDPEVYADPERLDLTRSSRHYLYFGHGIHYCVGGPLARIEARVGIGQLLQRLPDLAPELDRVEWGDRIFLRGPRFLPMTF